MYCNNITTNDTIRNNNNVVFFNNNIVGQFPVPVHDVAGSSFSSSAAALSLVRNNQTTMQAVVHATNNVEQEKVNTLIQTSNRNNRRTKKANKGSRPCNRTGRRKRKEKIGVESYKDLKNHFFEHLNYSIYSLPYACFYTTYQASSQLTISNLHPRYRSRHLPHARHNPTYTNFSSSPCSYFLYYLKGFDGVYNEVY